MLIPGGQGLTITLPNKFSEDKKANHMTKPLFVFDSYLPYQAAKVKRKKFNIAKGRTNYNSRLVTTTTGKKINAL